MPVDGKLAPTFLPGPSGQTLCSSGSMHLAWQRMRTSATWSLACSTQASPASTHWNPFTTSVTSRGWWVTSPSPQVTGKDPSPVSPRPPWGTTSDQVAESTSGEDAGVCSRVGSHGATLSLWWSCLSYRVDLRTHGKVTQTFCEEALSGLQVLPSAIGYSNKNTCFLPPSGLTTGKARGQMGHRMVHLRGMLVTVLPSVSTNLKLDLSTNISVRHLHEMEVSLEMIKSHLFVIEI